jgi:hypothetical protein
MDKGTLENLDQYSNGEGVQQLYVKEYKPKRLWIGSQLLVKQSYFLHLKKNLV